MLVRYYMGEQRSGRLGATIASHNRYGDYLRAGTVPVNPNTARQNVVRTAMASLTIAWVQTLTQVQRDAWDLYGANTPWRNKLGAFVALTGLAHFVRANTPRLQAELAQINDAPTTFTYGIPEMGLDVSASEATQQLSIGYDDTQPWCDNDGAAQVFFMGAPQNASRKFFGSPYRFIGVVEGDSVTPPTSPFASVDTPNFPFAEGQRIWLRSRLLLADGRMSHFAQTDFLAGA